MVVTCGTCWFLSALFQYLDSISRFWTPEHLSVHALMPGFIDSGFIALRNVRPVFSFPVRPLYLSLTAFFLIPSAMTVKNIQSDAEMAPNIQSPICGNKWARTLERPAFPNFPTIIIPCCKQLGGRSKHQGNMIMLLGIYNSWHHNKPANKWTLSSIKGSWNRILEFFSCE